MGKRFLKKIRETLLAQRKDILSKMNDLDIDVEGDEVDYIQGNILASVNAKLSRRDQERVRQIDAALGRLENDAYGKCLECGENIAEKRLELNPFFSICFDCAEAKEDELKREGASHVK